MEHTGEVLFLVLFSGITFKIFKGEIAQGVMKHSVFLRCGPIQNMYLSDTKMPDYKYVMGENPIFTNEKNSRIQVETKVRVLVTGTKWMEVDRAFQALARLEGDYLGSISEE